MIIGADWLKSNESVIDFQTESFTMKGEKVPDKFIMYRALAPHVENVIRRFNHIETDERCAKRIRDED